MTPLFVLAHMMHHVPGFIMQPLLPSIRDTFKLDYTSIGWLTSSYNLAYGISNLPAGWLAGRIAPRLLITAGVAGVAVFGLLVGLSPTYIVMVFAMIFMGILGGGYHPTASPLVSDATPEAQRGRALGVHQIGGTAANIITPLLATGIAAALTWRGSYIVLTIPTIAFGIVLYSVLKKRRLGDTPFASPSDSFTIHINPRGYLRHMVAFIAMGTAVQVFVFTTLSFVTLLVVDEFGGSKHAGAALFALSQFAGLWAGPIGGHIADRIGKTRVMLTVGLASGPLIYLLSLGAHWWLLPFVLLALGTCMYVAMPVSEAYVISNASQRNRSTILGVYYFASRGGPGILSPIIGGLLDKFGFGPALASTGAAMFAIALFCSLMLWGSKE